MITYSNITRFEGQSFDDYLKLDGASHSYLKNNRTGVKEAITITENIRIGALVDNILTEPERCEMADPLYPFAKDIAYKIKEFLGPSIAALKSQISFTGDASFGDFNLHVKGRLDFLLENIATIDIKVTKSKQIDQLIEFMGYKNQLWHYSKLAVTPKAYLVIYSIPLKRVFVKSVDVSGSENDFWLNKIVDFGTVNV